MYSRLSTYIKAWKLTYSIMADILESPTGKHKALLKLSTLLCWYRPSLTVASNSAVPPALWKKHATRVPGSIAIYTCRSSQSLFFSNFHKRWLIIGAL